MSDALRLWLTQELDHRGWSQREFARQIGLNHSFVSKTLAGDRKPSVNFCNKVAAALDVAPETILRLAGIIPPASPVLSTDDPILQELVELTRILTPEQRQQILDYARYISQQGRKANS